MSSDGTGGTRESNRQRFWSQELVTGIGKFRERQ
jgi:hypothetical protein